MMKNKMYMLAHLYLFLATAFICATCLQGEIENRSAAICGFMCAGIFCLILHVFIKIIENERRKK